MNGIFRYFTFKVSVLTSVTLELFLLASLIKAATDMVLSLFIEIYKRSRGHRFLRITVSEIA